MNKQEKIARIIEVLKTRVSLYAVPLTDAIVAEYGRDPFLILISCLLSLRARDSVTIHVCRDLFSVVTTPSQIRTMPLPQLERIIYKSGYYKNKARTLKHVSHELLNRFDGKVPARREDLLSIKGIGIKTANLVVGLAFGIPAICVDIHVHRISNRLGLITTQKAEQTLAELTKILPRKDWIIWNHLLVIWGQNICVPISPKCTQCPLAPLCPQVGVKRFR